MVRVRKIPIRSDAGVWHISEHDSRSGVPQIVPTILFGSGAAVLACVAFHPGMPMVTDRAELY